MKKIALMIIAAAAIFTAVPASAQTVVIREGMTRTDDGYRNRDRGYRSRAEFRRDRGYRRGWDRRDRRRGGPAIVIRP